MTSTLFDSANPMIGRVLDGLRAIGYTDPLIRYDYPFADPANSSKVRSIAVAAFGAEPPSYRTACLGLVVSHQVSPESVAPFRSLGAPQVFALEESTNRLTRWRMQASGAPAYLEELSLEDVIPRFLTEREAWAPAAVLRLKSADVSLRAVQFDFFDAGLLPSLESEVHRKLDQLLGDVVAAGRDVWFGAREPKADEAAAMFRLVFRFLSFKLLLDRGSEIVHAVNPDLSDARAVLQMVNELYSRTVRPNDVLVLPPVPVQRLVWQQIRDGLRLQNLSVEALAFVYENTMVSRRQRRSYGTHATPWRIAEYIIRELPLESLALDERTICEPFSGHAPFLVTALGRLKALTPGLDVESRHSYLVRMLSGIEVDSFAAEVARYSLMLADYPASNGWRIREGDVFHDAAVRAELEKPNVIVSNPPYEDFGDTSSRAGAQHPNKAVAALRLFLDSKPRMLGVVLPQAFIDGHQYIALRNEVANLYGNTQVLWLPDVAFAHADTETAVLIATRDAPARWKGRISAKVPEALYAKFDSGASPALVMGEQSRPSGDALWEAPLAEVWRALQHLPTVGDLLESSSRGIEYSIPVRDNVSRVLSATPRSGFRRGVFTSSGPGFAPFVLGAEQLLSSQ